MPLTRRLSQWIVRHALLVLGLGAAVTVFFALQLPRLELDPSAEGIMVEDDPARDYYEHVKEVFGTDSTIAIAIHRPDTIFRRPTLAKIQQMASELGALDGVERVLSLATTDNLGDCKEGLRPGPVYTEAPATAEAVAEIERLTAANYTFLGNLVSEDHRTAGLIVFVDVSPVDRKALGKALHRALASDAPLPARLLDDLLYSPTFAAALRRGVPQDGKAPADGESLAALRRAVARAPEVFAPVARRLLADDPQLRHTLLREAPTASRQVNAQLVGEVSSVLERHRDDPAEQIYQIGNPVMKLAATRHQRRDLSRLLPCTLALVALVLFVAFRSLRGVAIPLGTVFLSLVWTFGAIALLETPLTIITVIVGPLLIAVGNCYAMHIVTHYYHLARPDSERQALAQTALESCFLPVLLSGLTTMVGFLSVSTSKLSSIREFGLFSAFGILSTLAISLTLAPALLRYLPPPRRTATGASARIGALGDRILRAIGRVDARHGGLVLGLGIVFVGLSIAGCFRLFLDSNYLTFFLPNDPIRIYSDRMHDELAGAVPFYVVLDARQWRGRDTADGDEWRGPFTDPKLLQFQLGLQAYMGSLRPDGRPDGRPVVDKSISFADHVALMYKSYVRDHTRALPETRDGVEGLLDFFFKREDAEKYVSADFAQANLYVRTHTTSSSVLRGLVERVEAYGRQHAPPGVEVTVTGESILILRAADEIAVGQVRSLSIAFLVIFTLMTLLFASAKAGLLSIIPNAVPIIGTFGLIGWLGVSLNSGTSLVASVALGIAVDDTIHYMSGFNTDMRRLGDQTQAMLSTLYSRGKAIIFTSVALFCGFMILTVSNFAPISAFGYLTAAAMVTALLGDIFILPVLLRHVGLVTLWDILKARPRGDPREWLGILRGLSASDARRIILMGVPRHVTQGAVVLRGGSDVEGGPVWASGDRLFAVLSGRLEVRAHPDEGGAVLATLDQGDVFVEAALAPRLGQPPDVVATQDTDLLIFDDRTLDKLIHRRPRLAVRLCANLAFVLAERLHAVAGQAVPAEAVSPLSQGRSPRDLFADLSADHARAVRELTETRSAAAGDALAPSPESGRELLAVVEGRVAVAAVDLGAGAVFGGAQGATARALEPTTVLAVTDESLKRLIERSPRAAARWTRELARILSRSLHEVAGRRASTPDSDRSLP